MIDDTNEDPGYDPTLCKCGEDANPSHMCPYKTEMFGDYETLCNCCDECTNQCGYDI